MQPIAVKQPRARGSASIVVRDSVRGTELASLRHEGSLRAMFPRGSGKAMTVVMTNTSGGVTGGDRFRVEVNVGPDANLTLTTQTAERAYRAQPGETGHVDTRLTVRDGGRLKWLPQETILFQRCSIKRRLQVDLAPTASALIVEPLVFGRVAMGEILTQARFSDRIELHRSGKPLYLDQLNFDGDVHELMQRAAIGDGAGAIATIVFVDENVEALIDAVRACLPETAGASLVRKDVLSVRILAADSFRLRQSLLPVITTLTNEDLPRPWMI